MAGRPGRVADGVGRYREALAGSSVARLQDGFGDAWVSSVCVLELTGTDADRLERRMASMAIETRRWWGNGAHAHASMSACPRTPLPITEELARSTLAVPIFRDLKTADVESCHRVRRDDAGHQLTRLPSRRPPPTGTVRAVGLTQESLVS